ncbi:hypothetical protein KGA66_06485 [Actinocrinis puniceicyclus]|uniref:Tat pathway signal sequence domain protein n=1 Tax=Actinocrinis puniceicyclus TaxID=977794 RepID=A0A8J7WNH0_9ACTN|nr:hypothetical protein [Actinocrinis puniceicyclus]MBS2962685.1 hypothetical protein [Actinocrinis puniceicyclus]
MRRRKGSAAEPGHEAPGPFRRRAHGRAAGAAARSDDGPGALEIEFEDDDTADRSPVERRRDLRPAALSTLAAVLLGAALSASHHPGAPGTAAPNGTPSAAPPDFGAYVVTVAYQGSHIDSTAQRRIEVDLKVKPVTGAKVRIIAYYVSENGVSAAADPAPSADPLPAAGTDVRLRLTVTDCATVPIGESMGFVDVIADGPAGVIDRFTILGARYSADMTGLLRRLCPGRSAGQAAATTAANSAQTRP